MEIAFVYFNRMMLKCVHKRLMICCKVAIILDPSAQDRFYFREEVIRKYSYCLHFDMRGKIHILPRGS